MDNDRELFEQEFTPPTGVEWTGMSYSPRYFGESIAIVVRYNSMFKAYQAALSHSKERIAELEKDAAMEESK